VSPSITGAGFRFEVSASTPRSDRETAEVRDASPSVSLPFTCNVSTPIAVELLDDLLCERVEVLRVVTRPPVLGLPAASYCRPWSSKPCHLVAITMPIAP
jgi:hypothetical protein